MGDDKRAPERGGRAGVGNGLGDDGGLSERGGRAGVKNILEDDEGVSERGGGKFKWEVETEGATSTKERCRNKLEAKRDQLSTTIVKAP